MPSRPAPHPFWKTAVTTPNAAAADSRFITAPMAGMTRLRKTAMSSRKLSATTTAMKSGSLRARTRAKSSKIAVWPPTRTRTPDPFVAAGTVVLRSLRSSVVVACDCGEVVGYALATATSPPPRAGRTRVAVTALTPGTSPTAARARSNTGFCPAPSSLATSMSGPL